ncbi:MAG: gamma-glutamylcyclotransferase [Ilumatobacter sp.]|nr:gamma-glutamylcyclotransferase [Ilumatobacter sp.]MDJ0768581.1 gamma-glutamylcyclotransferase [Ilumatobacter sp.]
MNALESIRRLAVYGTLAPGRPNEHVLADLLGRWIEGTVRGELRDAGWGAELGFPGIVLDAADGGVVEVVVLESEALPAHWDLLDAFEGPGYRRTVTTVRTPAGELDAAIYVLADD